MAQLSLKERTSNNVTILDLSGKITIGEGAVQLREAIRRLMDEGKKQILLNLGGVSYIDSAGVGELISSQMTTTHHGGRLKLENLTGTLRDLMTIPRLLTVFETFEDEKNAVESFN